MLASKASEMSGALANRELSSFVRECQIKYWHWDTVRILARERGFDPEMAWVLVKLGRLPERVLPLTGAAGQGLSLKLTDGAQRELMLIDQQLAGRLRLDADAPISPDMRDRFVINSLMEEAIASSMLEGAATTRRVAKEMLREDRAPRTDAERMVANNFRTMLFLRENHADPLTPERIVELQGMLTEGTLAPIHVRRLRAEADRVDIVDRRTGEIVHIPPPAGELRARLKRLCQFANQPDTDGDAFVHPVVRAVVLHFQLAYDHPFCDGNGRTARGLFYWSMLRAGYRIFEFLPISRLIHAGPANYVRAFLRTETDDFDGTYFLLYHLGIIRRARDEFRRYIARKMSELSDARRLFKSDAAINVRQQAMLLHVLKNPDDLYTIESHQRSHDVAYGTARADLVSLANAGYLIRRRSGNRFEFAAGPKLLRAARRVR